MNDEPISARPLVFAVVIVLVLWLLALGAPAGLAEGGTVQNQTVPTFTPTPAPVTPSPTPSVLTPTRATGLPRASRTPTPEPGSSATPVPPPATPSPAFTPPVSTATPSQTGPETPPPGATLHPAANATPSPEATVGPPAPGDEEPSAAPLSTSEASEPAAGPTEAEALPTLPPWTPAMSKTALASSSSCLWPVAGLLLVALGVPLLVWRGRQPRK